MACHPTTISGDPGLYLQAWQNGHCCLRDLRGGMRGLTKWRPGRYLFLCRRLLSWKKNWNRSAWPKGKNRIEIQTDLAVCSRLLAEKSAWYLSVLLSCERKNNKASHLSGWWYTSSTAQGSGGSFKNWKPIGEVGCCESQMTERILWWTDRWLTSPLFLSFSLCFSLSLSLSNIYLVGRS